MNFRDLITLPLSKAERTKKNLLNDSKVFCMAPWLQLHAQTNGKIAPCCMSNINDETKIGDLHENPNLEDAWNSDRMKQLRVNMQTQQKSSICSNCYAYEKVGKFSERMQYNTDFKNYYSRVEETLKDGTFGKLSVPIIDIRFSNKCNYKCRICSSEYSSLWYEDEQKLNLSARPPSKEMKVVKDEAEFWKSYERLLPGVKRLHFAGGEPLFMDEHYRTLEYLISIGKTDVNLTYNTNFSTLRYKNQHIVDLWNKFKKVDVWASLDGMGERGDYQRKGQRWEKIEENIRTIQMECPSVIFGVNVTVSLFNVLHIPEFYKHMVDQKLVQPDRMNLYLLFGPHYFSVITLPPAIKQKVIYQFELFQKEYLDLLPNSNHITNHIKAVVTYMMSENVSYQRQFQNWVNEVDKIRGEKFITTFPELAELMSPAY